MLRDRENRDPLGRKPAISPGGGAERLNPEPCLRIGVVVHRSVSSTDGSQDVQSGALTLFF